MDTETTAIPKPIADERPEPPPLREEMRPARGLIVGLTLSLIIWLALLVFWLAA